MATERLVEAPDSIHKEARKNARHQTRRAKSISRKAKIAKTFDLTDSQMSVFNSAYAMYLQTKSDREASDLAKNQHYEMMLKYPVLKYIARIVLSSAEREKLTARILKRSVEDQSKSFYAEEGGIGPQRLVNVANYLSTKYLEDPDSFSEQVINSQEYVERILRS